MNLKKSTNRPDDEEELDEEELDEEGALSLIIVST